MNPRTPTHTIKAKVWLYQGPAAWHFVTLPRKAGEQIRRDYGVVARGWGAIPVTVKIGRTEWKTSLFPDKKSKSYLLPLSAAVRKAEHLSAGNVVKARIDVRWRELG